MARDHLEQPQLDLLSPDLEYMFVVLKSGPPHILSEGALQAA
jgi:hypothetical protein